MSNFSNYRANLKFDIETGLLTIDNRRMEMQLNRKEYEYASRDSCNVKTLYNSLFHRSFKPAD